MKEQLSSKTVVRAYVRRTTCITCGRWGSRARASLRLQFLTCICGCAHLFAQHTCNWWAEATLEVRTTTLELGLPLSLARRKEAFYRNIYTNVKAPDGTWLAEPVLTHRRQDGSFQLLYNSCTEHANSANDRSFETEPSYGCVARLFSISATGLQVGGENHVDLQDVLPESRVVGYWTPFTECVDGENNLEKAIFAVWAAVCPTAEETCECTEEHCILSLEHQGTKSAFRDYASSSTFKAEKGVRLCVGKDNRDDRLGRTPIGRFVYWLVEGSGWVCGFADKHGAYIEFDEEHPHGLRVGSLFLVQKREGAAGYDITTVLVGARLEYPFGFNAVSVGTPEFTSTNTNPADDNQIAVVVRGRYFDEDAVKTEPGCFALAVAKDSGGSGSHKVLKMSCRPCGFAAVLRHPHLEQLITVCEEERNPPTLFVDGKAAVAPTNLSDSAVDYPESLSPVFVADDFRSWSIVWQNVAYVRRTSGKAKSIHSSIALTEWNQQLQAPFKGVELIRKTPAHKQNRHYVAPFGDSSLLVAYQEGESHTAVLAEVALDGSIVNDNFLKVTRIVKGTFLPLSYGDIFMRRKRKEVIWYSQWVETSSRDGEPECLTPLLGSSRLLRMITVKESDETGSRCNGSFGRTGTSCDESCHHLQSYEAAQTSAVEVEHACPFASGTTFAEPCFEEECSHVAIEAITTSTSADVSAEADGDLKTAIKSVGQSSIFEIALRSPSEIWALKGFFVPHGRTEFSVTLLDQRKSVIYTKTAKLSGHVHDGLAVWEWRHMLFYRAQYIRLEASSKGRAGELLELAEFRVVGRELELCPPEGFFASEVSGCTYQLDFLLKSAYIWDCQGVWSEWSFCDSTCRSTRFLKVEQQAMYAGKPCLLFEKKPCDGKFHGSLTHVRLTHPSKTEPGLRHQSSIELSGRAGGPFCNSLSPTSHLNGRRSQDCIFVPSGWSECRGCRRLKVNHRAREASGNTQTPCPPVLEVEECGPPCDSEYDKWRLRGNTVNVFTHVLQVAHQNLVHLTVVAVSILMAAAATILVACTAQHTQAVESN